MNNRNDSNNPEQERTLVPVVRLKTVAEVEQYLGVRFGSLSQCLAKCHLGASPAPGLRGCYATNGESIIPSRGLVRVRKNVRVLEIVPYGPCDEYVLKERWSPLLKGYQGQLFVHVKRRRK